MYSKYIIRQVILPASIFKIRSYINIDEDHRTGKYSTDLLRVCSLIHQATMSPSIYVVCVFVFLKEKQTVRRNVTPSQINDVVPYFGIHTFNEYRRSFLYLLINVFKTYLSIARGRYFHYSRSDHLMQSFACFSFNLTQDGIYNGTCIYCS